jgi:hypothetical protein
MDHTFKFNLRAFCKEVGVPPGTASRWLSYGALPLRRTEDGGILIDSARELAALSCVLPLVRRGGRRQAIVRFYWGHIVRSLDLTESRDLGERAWMVLDPGHAWGFKGIFLTTSPDAPVPEQPSHQVVALSDLEDRWRGVLARVAGPMELFDAAKAEGLLPLVPV